MPRKGENIFYRKDGRWEARYFKGYNIEGRYTYGYVYGKTYTEVKNKRNEVLIALKTFDKQHRSTDSFGYVVKTWLLQKKSTIKDSTYARYVNLINNHIMPKLGNVKAANMNDEIIALFINEGLKTGNCRNKSPLSNKMVKDIVTLLKQITTYADIRIKITSPRVVKKDIVILTEEEQMKFEDYLIKSDEPVNIGMLIALYTGLRIGEICALKWDDIDIEKKQLRVKHTMIRIKNLDENSKAKTKVIIDEPKTITSKRVIPLPPTIINKISKLSREPGKYVLSNTEAYLEPRNCYNQFKKILKALNMPNYCFHTLRHTFATKCIELGFDPKALSEILGHSDIKITLALYVHPSDKQKEKYMEKFSLRDAL